MALRIGSTLLQNIASDAVFNHTTGATIVGMAKRRVDAGADQALVGLWPSGMGYRHELYITAADELLGAVNWQASQTAVLATNPSGWFWFAIRLNRVSGVPRVKFYFKPHLSGSVVSADLTDGGAETANGSPIDYEFRLGEGVAPWVVQSQADYAYVKAWEAALSDAEISAEMNSFAQVRTSNEHSYLTLVGKADLAAALVDESGQTNDWTAQGTPTLDDAANPAAFGGTPPTIAVSSVTPTGASIAAAGTYTSTGATTVTVVLEAGSSGVTKSATASAAGGNWSVTFTDVAAGVYTVRATVADTVGSVLASSSTVEVVGLSGSGVLPHVYAAGTLTVTPESASLSVSGTQVLTVVDANGLPLDGVVFTSSAPAVATVSSPSNASGQVTVTGVAAGSSTIQASFSDPVSGTLSDSVAIAVALLTPAAPSGLVAVSLGSGRVRLTWVDNASGETSQSIERASAPTGPWTQVLTPASNAVTIDDTTVAAGATYYYRAKAINGDGPSAPSNVATVTVPGVADTEPPTVAVSANVLSVTVANSTVVVEATAADNVGVTEVRFYRNGVQVGAMLTAPNASGGKYQVQQSFVSSSENGTYQFYARAWDAAGNSTISVPINVVVNISAVGVPPAAPSNLAASLVTSMTMRLTWQDNSADETAFLLERRLLPGGAWEAVMSLAADTTVFDAAGLLANAEYGWRVRAQGAQANSGYSNEIVQRTLPAAATGLGSLVASPMTVSDVPGDTAVVTVTALANNGASRPGVTITPTIATPGIATVVPPNAITDASGKASFTVTFGAVIGQTELTFVANDGSTQLAPPATPAVQVFSLPTFTETLVKELQAEQTDPKFAEEVTPLVWDFSPYMGRNEDPLEILSRESVPVGGQDRDPSSSSMLFGDARIVGDRVLQFIRDGVPGVSYYLRCKVRTSLGRVAVAEHRVRIYRGSGSRVSSGTQVVD